MEKPVDDVERTRGAERIPEAEIREWHSRIEFARDTAKGAMLVPVDTAERLLTERNRLAGIVEALASFRYPADAIGACFWCHQILWSQYGVRYPNAEHTPDCLYRRAVEWQAGAAEGGGHAANQ